MEPVWKGRLHREVKQFGDWLLDNDPYFLIDDDELFDVYLEAVEAKLSVSKTARFVSTPRVGYSARAGRVVYVGT